jgi:hypothetical protein
MTTFKLGKVEFVQQSQGFASAIKVQVSSLTSDECGAIPWDEFQVLSSNISCTEVTVSHAYAHFFFMFRGRHAFLM